MNKSPSNHQALFALGAFAICGFFAGCGDQTGAITSPPTNTNTNQARIEPAQTWNMKDKVTKTEAEWKQTLNAEQFDVLRKHGTERAFTGALWNNHDKGEYLCAGCGLPLFASDTKFESGSGWPSFWKPALDGHVGTKVDKSFFSTRTEVHCARCEGHLGHVFEDGPAPTGLRYCINSASLTFAKKP